MVDYSQFGQGLVLAQLVAGETPRFLVDVGAHDGLTGSNSRALLEQGWRGVLVEPVPEIFSKLQSNSCGMRGVSLVQAACSDGSGETSMGLGKDGGSTQMSSLSSHPLIRDHLSENEIAVVSLSLPDLFSSQRVPDDFGVLLVDTEGWDYNVLRGLSATAARPRVIVTEDFTGTDEEKYAFLRRQQYRFVGRWGCDSFWVAKWHTSDTAQVRLPIRRVEEDWETTGRRVEARVNFDGFEYGCLFGWAWINQGDTPEVILSLSSVDSPQRYLFRAFRAGRPDVAEYFRSASLLTSGFRCPIDVPGGRYEVRIVQQGNDQYSEDFAGSVSLP